MDHTALLNRVHPLLTNGNCLSAQSFEALFGTCTRTERVSTQMAGWNDNGRSYGGGGYNGTAGADTAMATAETGVVPAATTTAEATASRRSSRRRSRRKKCRRIM